MGIALFKKGNLFNMLGGRPRAQDILKELTAGDLLVAHLFSGRSTFRLHKIVREKAWQRYRQRKEIERLEREGLVRRNRHGSETVLQITRRGRDALDSARRRTARDMQRAAVWDGKWRMVTYDFPEKNRNVRNAVRYLLKKHGFFQVQKNIWMYPYDQKETIEFLENEPQSRECMSVHLIEKTNAEAKLKRHFGLR